MGIEYICKICNWGPDKQKSHYNNHLKSKKHIIEQELKKVKMAIRNNNNKVIEKIKNESESDSDSELDYKSMNQEQLVQLCKNRKIPYLTQKNKPYINNNLIERLKNYDSNDGKYISEEKKSKKVNRKTNDYQIDDITTADKLQEIFHQIHNLLRNKEKIAELNAMKVLNIIMTPYLLENNFDLNDEYKFSNIISEIESDGSNIKEKSIEIAGKFDKSLREIHSKLKEIDTKKRTLHPWLKLIKDEGFRKKGNKFIKEETLTVILYWISKIKVDEDIKGKLHEYMYGSRDKKFTKALGQYFTNREITKFAVQYVKPELNDDGTIPTMCDATAGTGGFAISYAEYMNKLAKEKGIEINWEKEQEKIYLYDADPNIKVHSLVNMLMINNVVHTNIDTKDSLETPFDRKYKYIFANPPFGGDKKGTKIDYNDVNQNIKNIGIETSVKELLFLQLYMDLLEEGGTCAIVLPDGVFTTNSNDYIITREKLIKEFNVLAIIDVPRDAFENTTTKTSVLVFQKPINKEDITLKIDFIDLIQNKIIVSINKKDLNNYYLKFNRYLKYEFTNPSYKKLSFKNDCIINLNRKLKKFDEYLYIDLGSVSKGILECKNIIKKEDLPSRAKRKVEIGDILLGSVRPNLENYLYITQDIYQENMIASTGFFIIRTKNENKLLQEYLYYYITNLSKIFYENSNGAEYPALNLENLQKIPIFVPDLKEQIEIIKPISVQLKLYNNILDKIKIFENLGTSYVKSYLNMKKYKKQKMGNICNFGKKSKKYASNGLVSGNYRFYVSSNNKCLYDNENNYKEEHILIGDGGEPNIHIDKDFSCSGHVIPFKTKDNKLVKNSWIYFVLKAYMEDIVNIHYTGTTICNIGKGDISEHIEIPIPSIEIQEEFDEIMEDIYRARDEQLRYKNKADKLIKQIGTCEIKYES